MKRTYTIATFIAFAGGCLFVIYLPAQTKAAPSEATPVIEIADLSKPGIKTEETGYRHVALSWNDTETWYFPWIIQRSTRPEFVRPSLLKNNQAADNTGQGSFRWLGINADNYVDLDDLEEDTFYYYRVAAITNMSDYRKTGTLPTFTDWKYGQVKTKKLKEKHRHRFDVTDRRYGAIPDDGQNDYPSVFKAFKAAEKAGGGTVFFPAGQYDLWPVDEDVKIIDNLPTLNHSGEATSSLFRVTQDNITFAGELHKNKPISFIKLFLWNKTPATQYLNILNRQGESDGARRYIGFLLDHIENFTLKDLDIDAGAVAVSTGKRPGAWGLEFKQKEWDESHKLVACWNAGGAKNVVIDNVDTRNWRGEVYYNGGGSEKWLIKDGEIRGTNSSAISGSFDLELVNMVIAEAANACVESALFSKVKSRFNNRFYNQNHMARGCTFIGMDQGEKGFMKNLPGQKTFNGWLCFNQKDTYQTVSDCSFRDTIYVAFGPWYEYRNGFLYNSTFTQIPGNHAGRILQLNTTAKKQYQLEGGMSEILWLDNQLQLKRNMPNHQVVLSTIPGIAAEGNQSPWIWEGFHIKNVSDGKLRLNRFWVDSWNLKRGREQVIFKDFTKDHTIRFDKKFLYDTKPNKIPPIYQNFFE